MGQQHVHHRWRAGLAEDQVGHAVRRQPPPQQVRLVHRRGQSDAAQARGAGLQPGQSQRQKVPALGGVDGVDLVDDHRLQVGEIGPRPVPGAEQGELFGRGQQDVGRMQLLPLAFGHACVAGAGFHADRKTHFVDRRRQVARDVHRQGLQRRDVEGVQPVARRVVGWRALGQLHQARQEPCQGLAAAGGGDEHGMATLAGLLQHVQLVPARPPAATLEPLAEARRERRQLVPGRAGRRPEAVGLDALGARHARQDSPAPQLWDRSLVFPFCFGFRRGGVNGARRCGRLSPVSRAAIVRPDASATRPGRR